MIQKTKIVTNTKYMEKKRGKTRQILKRTKGLYNKQKNKLCIQSSKTKTKFIQQK